MTDERLKELEDLCEKATKVEKNAWQRDAIYSFSQLIQEVKRLREQNATQLRNYGDLFKENHKLREALRFYADESNYQEPVLNGSGKAARQALGMNEKQV